MGQQVKPLSIEPGFYPCDRHGGRREPAPARCLPASIHGPRTGAVWKQGIFELSSIQALSFQISLRSHEVRAAMGRVSHSEHICRVPAQIRIFLFSLYTSHLGCKFYLPCLCSFPWPNSHFNIVVFTLCGFSSGWEQTGVGPQPGCSPALKFPLPKKLDRRHSSSEDKSRVCPNLCQDIRQMAPIPFLIESLSSCELS